MKRTCAKITPTIRKNADEGPYRSNLVVVGKSAILETQLDGTMDPPFFKVRVAEMQPPPVLWTLRWTRWPWQLLPTADMITEENAHMLRRLMPSPSFYSEVHVFEGAKHGNEAMLLQERRTILMFRDEHAARQKLENGIEHAQRKHMRVEKVEKPLRFIQACNATGLDVLVIPEQNNTTHDSTERHWAITTSVSFCSSTGYRTNRILDA